MDLALRILGELRAHEVVLLCEGPIFAELRVRIVLGKTIGHGFRECGVVALVVLALIMYVVVAIIADLFVQHFEHMA